MAKNPYYSGPVTDHFDGTRFFIDGHEKPLGLRGLMKWNFSGQRQKWPASTHPVYQDAPPTRVEGDALRVSYIGHASFLIQTQALNILIDPVFSTRASPVSFAGPKRVNPPGISIENLPPIDVVLVSHNHYDHLDLSSLKRLHQAHAPRILTPLGNDTILEKFYPDFNVEAYDWQARVQISPDVAVHFEPANHWSARGTTDRFMALWCAFVLETKGGNIYHIADTGFGNGRIFDEVRAKHGTFRLAILPIGAYEPRWVMQGQHINPAEAVQILQATGAERAIAHHWGTFQLTDEAIHAPLEALEIALAAQDIDKSRFLTPRPGQAVVVP